MGIAKLFAIFQLCCIYVEYVLRLEEDIGSLDPGARVRGGGTVDPGN